MSVNYRVVRRTLNFDKANPKEVVVAQTEPRATTGLEALSTLIGQISAISRGDVLSVISTLTRLIADELAKGNIVEIGELGRLRFNMRSKAAKSVKEFTHNNILPPTLHFLPGMLLKDARRRIRFTLADEKGKTAEDKGKPVTPPNSGSGSGTSSSGEGNE